MKHPALARVFAVVLAILGVVSLAAGITGFRKNNAEHTQRQAYEEKFSDRIENYVRLHEQVESSADYEQTRAALTRVYEEHERAAAQHKTDTAIYSATKGGLRMGEDIIVVLQAQMTELRDQLRDADERKAFLEGLLTELIASNKSRMPWLDAMANTAAGYAVDSYTDSARITVITSKLRALMEVEPSPFDYAVSAYEAPEEPVMPTLPQLDAGGSYADMQAAYQAAVQQYQSAAAAYAQASADYARQLQAYYDAVAREEMERLNRAYDQARGNAMAEAYSAEYQRQHDAWEKECKNVKGETELLSTVREIRRLSLALSSLVRQADSYASSAAAETGGVYPGLEALSALAESTAARLDQFSRADLAELSNEEFLQLLDQAQDILDMIGDACCVISSNLYNPAGLITELLDKLHITEVLAQYLDNMLEKAEHEMQAQLEELWYQMGEAEKDQVRLAAEKLGLDEEAKVLARQTLDADELKELRNRHTSARLLLVNVPEVKSGMDSEEQLVASARAYLDTYSRETGRLYKGKLLVNVLSVLAGIMALAGIPSAYELLRSRFLLLAPVVLCLVCAAGAEGLNLVLGQGQLYGTLFTAIFALLQLLIVLPKSKQARRAPKHLKA